MKRVIYSILALSAIALTSCKEDDVTEEETVLEGKKYTIALKSNSDDETEYIIERDDLMTGTIDASEGIELIGWRYMYETGGTLYSSGYQSDNKCDTYSKNNDGNLELTGSFTFYEGLNVFGTSEDESTVLAIEVNDVGDSKHGIYSIDASSGDVTGIKTISNFYTSHNDTVQTTGWPTAITQTGDHVFIPFIQYASWTNPISDTAKVAVLSYPEMEFEKYITDARTGYIGSQGALSGVERTEDGDLYSFSTCSGVAGVTQADKPSGILKINSGETDFDPDYFFNVEEVTGGHKIFRMHYLGNGKAYARLITDETPGSWGMWTAYGRDPEAFVQKSVIIDLEAKTVTDIANVPLSALRWTAPLLIEDDVFYLSVETADDAYIYQVDMATATGTKGAKIDGKTVKGIFKL